MIASMWPEISTVFAFFAGRDSYQILTHYWNDVITKRSRTSVGRNVSESRHARQRGARRTYPPCASGWLNPRGNAMLLPSPPPVWMYRCIIDFGREVATSARNFPIQSNSSNYRLEFRRDIQVLEIWRGLKLECSFYRNFFLFPCFPRDTVTPLKPEILL